MKKRSYMLVGALSGALAVALGLAVLASGVFADSAVTSNSASVTPAAPTAPAAPGRPAFDKQVMTAYRDAYQVQLKNELAGLVTSGTITQAQADAITSGKGGCLFRQNDQGSSQNLTADQKTAVQAAMQTARKNALQQLVAAGTLTQDQADKMGAAQNGMCFGGQRRGGQGAFNGAGLTQDQMTKLQAAQQAAMKSALAKLVADGTITQAQADAMTPQNGMRMKGGDSGLNLTQTQMTAFKTAMSDAMKTAIQQLVADGTITQDQADKINTPRPGMGNMGNGKPGPGPNGAGLTQDQMTKLQAAQQAAMKSALAKLVADGTITQAQADAMTPQNGMRMKGGDSGLNLTQAQMTALKTAMSDAMKTAVQQLVADGTITQDQADKLNVPPQMQNRPNGQKGSGGAFNGRGRIQPPGGMNHNGSAPSALKVTAA